MLDVTHREKEGLSLRSEAAIASTTMTPKAQVRQSLTTWLKGNFICSQSSCEQWVTKSPHLTATATICKTWDKGIQKPVTAQIHFVIIDIGDKIQKHQDTHVVYF